MQSWFTHPRDRELLELANLWRGRERRSEPWYELELSTWTWGAAEENALRATLLSHIHEARRLEDARAALVAHAPSSPEREAPRIQLLPKRSSASFSRQFVVRVDYHGDR